MDSFIKDCTNIVMDLSPNVKDASDVRLVCICKTAANNKIVLATNGDQPVYYKFIDNK